MAFVNSVTTKQVLTFTDKYGKGFKTSAYLPGMVSDPEDAGAAAIVQATADLSNAALVKQELQLVAQETGAITPTTGAYDRVQDKAMFEMRAANGGGVDIALPGPLEAIFGPDKVLVNTAHAGVAALVAFLKANCCDADGSPITGVKRAYKMRPSGQKKH